MQNKELTKILAWITFNYPKDFTAIKSDDIYDQTREYTASMFQIDNVWINIKFTYPQFDKHFGYIVSINGEISESSYISISLSDKYLGITLEPNSFDEFVMAFNEINKLIVD
jgi:hypothetical protein